MSSRFKALRNDGITPLAFEPSRLIDCCCGDRIFAGVDLTRPKRSFVGRPKWKLTTSGLNLSTRSQAALSNGVRLEVGTGAFGSSPSSV
jgi:hypothetical protein